MTVMTSGAERCVVQREGVGATARIIQRRALLLTRIVVDLPTLMVVRQGSKRLIGPGGEITIPAGGAAAIAGGRIFDVINRPAAGGIYEAEWLVCDPAVIAGFAADGEGAGRPIAEAMAIGTMAPDFASAVDRAGGAAYPRGSGLDRASWRPVCGTAPAIGGGADTGAGLTRSACRMAQQ
jgi:hypothetical protein